MYNLMETKSLKLLEFFIWQNIYSAKINSGEYILLLLTLTRTMEISHAQEKIN